MRALILTLLFIPAVSGGAAGRSRRWPACFPSSRGRRPTTSATPLSECSASNAPAVRIVAIQGLVPEGIPKSSPRPSIELVVNGALDTVMGKPLTVVPKAQSAAGNAMALSCPVVGDCAAAETGAMTVATRHRERQPDRRVPGEVGDWRATGRPLHRHLARLAGEVQLDSQLKQSTVSSRQSQSEVGSRR